MSDDLDEAIAALHQGELDAFLDGRKALSQRLKKAGDKEGAARVAALVKPTPSAWATNRASATARDAFVDLLQIGVELRRGMREALRGSATQDVAGMQRRQREAVEALVGEASRLLAEAKLPASDVVMSRVRTNLTTIGTTGRWGDAPSACLSKDLAPLDIAGLAALLEVSPSEEPVAEAAGPRGATSSAAESARAEGAKAEVAKAEDAKARAEAMRRAREEKLRALEADVAAAEAAHANREAAVTDLAWAVDAAEKAVAAAGALAGTTAAEAERLALLAAEAREAAARARHDAETASADLASAKREREKAAQEAIRSKTHLLVVRERLERAGRESD